MEIIWKQSISKVFKGIDTVVRIDMFPVLNREILQFTFDSINSNWRQGVWLACDKGIEVNGQEIKSALIWYDTSPKIFQFQCISQNGLLAVHNIWDKGQGWRSLSHTSGMLIESLPLGKRYCCNDIGFETKFDKVVFRIERTQTITH